jgi:hypothetical protein
MKNDDEQLKSRKKRNAVLNETFQNCHGFVSDLFETNHHFKDDYQSCFKNDDCDIVSSVSCMTKEDDEAAVCLLLLFSSYHQQLILNDVDHQHDNSSQQIEQS